METKIMQVFYDNAGFPYKDSELTIHYPIVGSEFVGSNNATEIRFYVSNVSNTASWLADIKLPNDPNPIWRVLTPHTDNGVVYQSLLLDRQITQIKGHILIGLKGFEESDIEIEDGEITINGTPTVVATGIINIAMNYTPFSYHIEPFTPSDLELLMSLIAQKLNVANGIAVINDLEEDYSTYENGQILYNVDDGNMYKKTGASTCELVVIDFESGILVSGKTLTAEDSGTIATKQWVSEQKSLITEEFLHKYYEGLGKFACVLARSSGLLLLLKTKLQEENYKVFDENNNDISQAILDGDYDDIVFANSSFEVNEFATIEQDSSKYVCFYKKVTDEPIDFLSLYLVPLNKLDTYFGSYFLLVNETLAELTSGDTFALKLVSVIGNNYWLYPVGGVGGGDVESVNGKTGAVVLKASDIQANNLSSIQANLERIDGIIDGSDESDIAFKNLSNTFTQEQTMPKIKVGTFSITNNANITNFRINDIAFFDIQNNGTASYFGRDFVPYNNNSRNLGSADGKWKNGYINKLIGTDNQEVEVQKQTLVFGLTDGTFETYDIVGKKR